MLTVLFTILFFVVFGKLLWFAVKAAWSVAKILVTIVLLPLMLIGLVLSGFVSIALVILVCVGAVSLVKAAL